MGDAELPQVRISLAWLYELYESKMREELQSFIDQNIVDMASFAKHAAPFLGMQTTDARGPAPLFLGSFRACKRAMLAEASWMNLDMEIDIQLSDDTRNGVLYQIHTHADRLELPITVSKEIKHSLMYRLICAVVGLFIQTHTKNMQRRHTSGSSPVDSSILSRMPQPAINWKAEQAFSREKFLERAKLLPPPMARFRVIDLEATWRNGERVVLVGYGTCVQQVGYTAISHTFGMPVYEVFDCRCASECSSEVIPRCLHTPCPHDQDVSSCACIGAAGATSSGSSSREKHKGVVKDILKMCDILRNAGVTYAWHDGVCIAQHDEKEVEEIIMHMGWIYASAKETVVFLHYVGNPMAPIRCSDDTDELGSRWHNRVWTLQEGAFSKSRRYCVKSLAGSSPLDECQTLEEFEEKVALWNSSASTIEVMEEEKFYVLLEDTDRVLTSLLSSPAADKLFMPHECDAIIKSTWMRHKAQVWQRCVRNLIKTLCWTCFEFVSIEKALVLCSSRDSKHVGDRMNSVLALAEVKDFVANKGERDTAEFFKRQGQRGLARALLSTNPSIEYFEDRQYIVKERRHTWPPILQSEIVMCQEYDDLLNCVSFEVLESGRMEVRGDLVCVTAEFTIKECFSDGHVVSGGRRSEEAEEEITIKELSDEGCVGSSEKAEEAAAQAAIGHQLMNEYGDARYLAMDLCFDWQDVNRFDAKLGNVKTGDVYISDVKCWSKTLSREEVWYEIRLQMRNIQFRDMDREICFRVHLVIPAQVKNPNWMVMVQGDLHDTDSAVSKVGAFLPTAAFKHWLQLATSNLSTPPACITRLQNLIII